MTYVPYQPKQIYIESSALNSRMTHRILSNAGDITPVIVESVNDVPASTGEKALILAHQKANFFKLCPGTHHYICCAYKILNLINNCEMNCSYCILQGYLSNPHITIYVNSDDMFSELEKLLRAHPNRYFRIGTGELADSLSTDHLTAYSKELVTFFADKRNAIIELKTKSIQIDNFVHEAHGGRTVVSWSLNTSSVISKDESGAPMLDQRLEAAKECQEAGFKIGFHFDPMIFYDGWEVEYEYVVDRVFKCIHPRNIIWISLGALRYPPSLDAIIRERHPESEIVYGELIPGLDGKYRYFKSIRIQMFKQMYRWIKKHDEHVFVYLCMSSSEEWQKSFGWTPRNSASLAERMDQLII